MSEFQAITTKAELALLDDEECICGYLAGIRGEPEPDSTKSKSYWHGWRNGMVDAGHAQKDDAQAQLAREVVGTYRGLH